MTKPYEIAVTDAHTTAMEYADLAFAEAFVGDTEAYDKALWSAYSHERLAAELLRLDVTCEPSRSVLYRSAASLALQRGEFDDARRLIALGLAGSPPHEIAEELWNLEISINERGR